MVETMVEQVQRLLDERLPKCDHHGEVVELITDQQVRLRLPYRNDFAGKDSWQGQSIPIFSGPTVFSLCDTAMFACVIAFCGPCVSPVMINSSISYISPAKQNDLLANAEIVRTGRNIGHLQCSVVCPEEDAVRAKATASYKLIHNSTDQQVTHA